MHADPDDLDSVTKDLRDSVKGSNDGYDVAFSLTEVKGVIVIVFVTVMYVVNSCVMIASVFSDIYHCHK